MKKVTQNNKVIRWLAVFALAIWPGPPALADPSVPLDSQMGIPQAETPVANSNTATTVEAPTDPSTTFLAGEDIAKPDCPHGGDCWCLRPGDKKCKKPPTYPHPIPEQTDDGLGYIDDNHNGVPDTEE